MMTRNDASQSETRPPTAPTAAPTAAPRPVQCGDLGLRILADGTWTYQGSPIGRPELVRLFASVLWRDGDGTHYMTTPAEHGTVRVDDAPFLAVELAVEAPEAGPAQRVRLRTNLDDWLTLDADHPLRVEERGPAGGPAPYAHVRRGLEARLNRPVFYDLVAVALEGKGGHPPPPPPPGTAPGVVGVWSAGVFFPIGRLDEVAEDAP